MKTIHCMQTCLQAKKKKGHSGTFGVNIRVIKAFIYTILILLRLCSSILKTNKKKLHTIKSLQTNTCTIKAPS